MNNWIPDDNWIVLKSFFSANPFGPGISCVRTFGPSGSFRLRVAAAEENGFSRTGSGLWPVNLVRRCMEVMVVAGSSARVHTLSNRMLVSACDIKHGQHTVCVCSLHHCCHRRTHSLTLASHWLEPFVTGLLPFVEQIPEKQIMQTKGILSELYFF